MPTTDRQHGAPSLLLSLLEAPRAFAEASLLIPTHRFLKKMPKGNGHAVMTLPGFLAGDISTGILRRYVELWGYKPYGWQLGRNLGLRPDRDLEGELDQRLEEVYEESGRRKVSLIGWSLGGLFARELGRRHPDRVRGIITLGTPLGHPKTTSTWRIYEYITKSDVDDFEFKRRLKDIRKPIPGVPVTAIYSKTDGIVGWQTSREESSDLTENVEVVGSHIGLGVNPMVLYVVADRLLCLSKNDWRPFDYASIKNTLNL